MPDKDPQELSGDAEIEAIRAELIANPAVDENAAAVELKDIKLPPPIVPATETELATEHAELLKEAKAMAEKTSKNIDAVHRAQEAAQKAHEAADKAAKEFQDAVYRATHPF